MVEEAIHDQAAMAWQDDSDSSMTLAESPDMPTPSWTRKRKRPIGSEEEGLNELWAMGQRQDAGKSAYLALSALLELSNGGPRSYHGGKGAYEKEYIKSVFRVDPALAAQLLGSSLKMIRVLYAEDLGSSPGEDDVSYLGNVMHPAVQAWNNRSGLFDDLQGRTSDVRRPISLFGASYAPRLSVSSMADGATESICHALPGPGIASTRRALQGASRQDQARKAHLSSRESFGRTHLHSNESVLLRS